MTSTLHICLWLIFLVKLFFIMIIQCSSSSSRGQWRHIITNTYHRKTKYKIKMMQTIISIDHVCVCCTLNFPKPKIPTFDSCYCSEYSTLFFLVCQQPEETHIWMKANAIINKSHSMSSKNRRSTSEVWTAFFSTQNIFMVFQSSNHKHKFVPMFFLLHLKLGIMHSVKWSRKCISMKRLVTSTKVFEFWINFLKHNFIVQSVMKN